MFQLFCGLLFYSEKLKNDAFDATVVLFVLVFWCTMVLIVHGVVVEFLVFYGVTFALKYPLLGKLFYSSFFNRVFKSHDCLNRQSRQHWARRDVHTDTYAKLPTDSPARRRPSVTWNNVAGSVNQKATGDPLMDEVSPALARMLKPGVTVSTDTVANQAPIHSLNDTDFLSIFFTKSARKIVDEWWELATPEDQKNLAMRLKDMLQNSQDLELEALLHDCGLTIVPDPDAVSVNGHTRVSKLKVARVSKLNGARVAPLPQEEAPQDTALEIAQLEKMADEQSMSVDDVKNEETK
eukprot:GFYU01006401.1.p1 GENE.GFYU01006401.1~~GFYU01006401.1.p1  ORF type:complete len:333 (+),score=93.88 GFYU01006401.1:120-1001(+)